MSLPRFVPEQLTDAELCLALNLLDVHPRRMVARYLGVEVHDLNAALRGIGWVP